MKLSVLCCTYLRPEYLGQLIECFLRQDYARDLCELVILDDAGQYQNQTGDRWRLISIPHRFRTLGEKRNACAALAATDSEGFVVADDDDIYLPHWLKTHAEALSKAEWSRPSLVYCEQGDALREVATEGLYHASWAYRRSAFDRVQGYRALNNGEDQDLGKRFVEARVTQADPSQMAPPFFVHRLSGDTHHVSWLDDAGYNALGRKAVVPTAPIQIGWPRDFASLPRIARFGYGGEVRASNGGLPVELIGPVNQMGRDGLTNALFAIQQALLKRIHDGMDWLTIKPLPVSRGALPWFWNWQDREYACWWDRQGHPFVEGPYVLFINSATPRIDALESALLDSPNCRGMFCNSTWYRDLIARHRGAANRSPIIVCPSPISDWPGPPLEACFDLLIYSKNGHRPQLAEHLQEAFPSHVRIDYGTYQRHDLFEAARRSRVCAYLADDDHGPLALQEILLAGCPTVGVRTGAATVRAGVTGYFVERLPPGRNLARDENDVRALAEFHTAIESAMQLDRSAVRHAAAGEFDTEVIVDNILNALNAARVTP